MSQQLESMEAENFRIKKLSCTTVLANGRHQPEFLLIRIDSTNQQPLGSGKDYWYHDQTLASPTQTSSQALPGA